MQYILIGFNILNSLILLVLLYIYARNYSKLKTKHNIGLLIFAFLFLVDNILAAVMGLTLWPCYSDQVNGIVLVRRISELIGFSALLYITWR